MAERSSNSNFAAQTDNLDYFIILRHGKIRQTELIIDFIILQIPYKHFSHFGENVIPAARYKILGSRKMHGLSSRIHERRSPFA